MPAVGKETESGLAGGARCCGKTDSQRKGATRKKGNHDRARIRRPCKAGLPAAAVSPAQKRRRALAAFPLSRRDDTSTLCTHEPDRKSEQGRIARPLRLVPMTVLVLSILWCVFVAWLIWHAFRQRNALQLVEPTPAAAGEEAARVCVIVPARDEGENIAHCLHSLMMQEKVELDIVVVDDNSNDQTAAVVETMARSDRRITLLKAPQLPPGWKGKVHACHTGLQAVPDSASWLCFMDADVKANPEALACAVRNARADNIDLLSFMPRQQLRSFAERLIMPCGLYILAFSQNVSAVQAPDSDDATATGQFMLFRRDAYMAIGGHAAVRNRICEDLELARLMKRLGGRVLLQDGGKVLSARMYTGWSTLWPGIAKNLYDMLGGALRAAVTGLIAMAMAWGAVLLPIFDGMGCTGGSQAACTALGPAMLGSGAVFALHIAGALHFGIPAWYGLLFPLGYTVGVALAFDSLRRKLTHRVRWKGRVYS